MIEHILPDTEPEDLIAAQSVYGGDWDAHGTISVYLPSFAAYEMLHTRGWVLHGPPRGGMWVPPMDAELPSRLRVFHEPDEALRSALTAEIIGRLPMDAVR